MRPLLRLLTATIVVAATVSALAQGQAPQGDQANPVSAGAKAMSEIIGTYITRAAEKVDEGMYAFKPVPEVRSFGQIVGHLADDNYLICAAANGEKPPAEGIEKTKTTKADLVKALADSLAYCGKAYAGLTDAKGAELVPFFGRQMARVSILDFNTAHNYEHYGNLVTYMRMKGIVPPSSEKR